MNSIHQLETSKQRAYAEGFIKTRLASEGVDGAIIDKAWRMAIKAAQEEKEDMGWVAI